MSKANVSPSKASAKQDESARRSMMPKTAGYSGATGNTPKAPEKSAKMMAKPTAKKAAAKPAAANPKTWKTKTKKADGGFNFGAEIARGFGGDTAWEREKKKAGVKD